MPTNRRVLKEAGDSIKRFLDSGVTELGDHLGPLLWQFAPTKKFDAADFGGFLELLPDKFDGRALRHVIEVRHDSFRTPEFIALLRKFAMAVVYTDHAKYPEHRRHDRRLRLCASAARQGHRADRLSAEGDRCLGGPPAVMGARQGARPTCRRRLDPSATKAKAAPRDVFAYVIHEGKVRAPAGAMALIERLEETEQALCARHAAPCATAKMLTATSTWCAYIRRHPS